MRERVQNLANDYRFRGLVGPQDLSATAAPAPREQTRLQGDEGVSDASSASEASGKASREGPEADADASARGDAIKHGTLQALVPGVEWGEVGRVFDHIDIDDLPQVIPAAELNELRCPHPTPR